MSEVKKPLTDLEMIENLIESLKKTIKDFEDNPNKRPQRKIKPQRKNKTPWPPALTPALGVKFWGSDRAKFRGLTM